MANKSILMYFLLVGFIIVNLLSTHSGAALYDEMKILIDFKKLLDDPDNILGSWNENVQDPCQWSHVSCSNNRGVIGLDLANTKISGPISQGLGLINFLENLDLHNSSFNGSLPESLGYPLSLKKLDLSLNQFSGPIPTTFNKLTNLQSFNVSFNHLSGEIPESAAFQRFGFSSFEGNPDLCGPVVGRNCSVAIKPRRQLQ